MKVRNISVLALDLEQCVKFGFEKVLRKLDEALLSLKVDR